MRKNIKLLGALAVAGVVATTGSAFTAGNTFATGATVPLTGYGTTTVSGGTINSLKYNLDGPGANVTSVSLVLLTDTSKSAVSLNFNNKTAFTCGIGTVASTASPVTTSYTCTPTAAQATSGLTSTGVVIN